MTLGIVAETKDFWIKYVRAHAYNRKELAEATKLQFVVCVRWPSRIHLLQFWRPRLCRIHKLQHGFILPNAFGQFLWSFEASSTPSRPSSWSSASHSESSAFAPLTFWGRLKAPTRFYSPCPPTPLSRLSTRPAYLLLLLIFFSSFSPSSSSSFLCSQININIIIFVYSRK